ncbi:MAG TPA: hypothetical protein VD866_32295, partial [Urbifossiella sp.]|nr:hypothetical protein [Urbifossiella sp.]
MEGRKRNSRATICLVTLDPVNAAFARAMAVVYDIDHLTPFGSPFGFVAPHTRLSVVVGYAVSRLDRAAWRTAGGVGSDQTRSHRTGMANFLHHAVAVAGLFGATGLTAESGVFARHPAATIPDTYRALRATGPGGVAVELAAGKYMPTARKVIWLIRNGFDSLRLTRKSLVREGIPCVACRSSATCRSARSVTGTRPAG